MKPIKNKFLTVFSLMLLGQQHCYTENIKEPLNNPKERTTPTLRVQDLLYPIAASLLALRYNASVFGIYQAGNIVNTAQTTTELLQHQAPSVNDFSPAAQEWYNNIAKKYPAANLNKKNFAYEQSDNIFSYRASLNDTIIFNTEILTIINKHFQPNLKDKKNIPPALEAVLLHEATHLNNNDLSNRIALNIGSAITIEGAYQFLKKNFTSSTIKKSLPKRFAIGATSFIAMQSLYQSINRGYARYQETRADKFAIQNADLPALENFIGLLNCLPESNAKVPLWLSTHPTTESRIQKVQEEIARRELDKIK